MDLQCIPVRQVQPGDDDNLVTGLHPVQRIPEGWDSTFFGDARTGQYDQLPARIDGAGGFIDRT
jgi:hypothetical protein